MKIIYKNRRFERWLIGVNVLTAAAVAACFVMLFGFYQPVLPAKLLYIVQIIALCIFIAEKPARLFNSISVREYFIANFFEVPLLLALVIAVFGAGRWFGYNNPAQVRHAAVGIYLIIQVVSKLCRTCVNLAASGKNPTQSLIASFVVLIVCGAGLLMLPRSYTNEMSITDALFTATSATCVTGLIVKNTGQDFTLMGKLVILTLIQLGGLGIVIFGAVFALLLGQALTVRESVAMQDLLSAQTLGRIGNIIGFIFVTTLFIEALGALVLFNMWDNTASWTGNLHQQWFYSIFHSISAFCNAGFSLFNDSFTGYSKSWGIYVVVCPLIILGGLGFPVLYNITNVIADRIKRLFKKRTVPATAFSTQVPKRLQLQTKVVLMVTTVLILFGMVAILILENNTRSASTAMATAPDKAGLLGALFQSITARTAGFNTVNIALLKPASKFVLILLMFIGGSPGSTAGGIKTVTLAVVIMTAYATLRKRREVEFFNRSIRPVVVGRAITVTLLFIAVLFGVTLALSITERANDFEMSDIIFETASALGTVGLSTGITASLTNTGKLLIIATMLIGRLGPLTLLAMLTFNLKPARYNYPDEAIIVG